MLIIIISRSSLKLDHVGSKTRLLGHQATQVSDLGPLWPSCLLTRYLGELVHFQGNYFFFFFFFLFFLNDGICCSRSKVFKGRWHSRNLKQTGSHKSCLTLKKFGKSTCKTMEVYPYTIR